MKSFKLILLAVLYPFLFNAQTSERLTSLLLDDNSQFGTGIAIDGDLAAVSTPNSGLIGLGMLVIYEFDGSAWSTVHTVQGSSSAGTLGLGETVEIIGRDVFVKASGPSVFRYSDSSGSWALEETITPTVGYLWSDFGRAMSKDGNRLLVGDPLVTINGQSHEGAVYVFEHDGTGWVEDEIIVNPDADAGFGSAIDIHGSQMIVGNPLRNTEMGSVYIYAEQGGTWSHVQSINSPENFLEGSFGHSVSISHQHFIAGAPHVSWSAGRAYAFSKESGSWSLSQILTDGGVANKFFGNAVAMHNGTALIGKPGEGVGEVSVHQIEVDGQFYEIGQLNPTGLLGNARFGESIAFNGAQTLVSSPDDSALGFLDGSATVFNCTDSDQDNICDAYDLCPGHSDYDDADGDLLPDACDICPNEAGNDEDEDGFCPSEDICHGYNDNIDTDGDGVPNGCEGASLDYCSPSFTGDCNYGVTSNWQYLEQISIFSPAGQVLTGGVFDTYLGHCPPVESCNTLDGSDYNFHPVGNTKDKCTGYPGTDDQAYIDVVDFNAGSDFDLFLIGNSASAAQLDIYGSSISVFIDWNQDGDFTDTEELVVSTMVKTWPTAPLQDDNFFSIQIPTDAMNGTTRMRVIISKVSENADPCLSGAHGSSREYQITIANGLNPCPTDITGDGLTNVNDFLELNSRFGDLCGDCPEDINKDGNVNVDDFLDLNSAFGNPCN
jgi:hypothetical protein